MLGPERDQAVLGCVVGVSSSVPCSQLGGGQGGPRVTSLQGPPRATCAFDTRAAGQEAHLGASPLAGTRDLEEQGTWATPELCPALLLFSFLKGHLHLEE